MAERIFFAVLSDDSGGITSTNNNSGSLVDGLNGRIQEGFRAFSEGREFEDTWWAVGDETMKFRRRAGQIYPFQRIVRASSTVSLYNARLLGPASRPIQPAAMPSWSVAEPVWEQANKYDRFQIKIK
jgi:hypothetical protein